jgi:prolyl oligopeptidase
MKFLRSGTLVSVTITFSTIGIASTAPLSPPPPLPQKPVTETLYGTTIVDPYRYMEKEDQSVIDWMKAEGRYTGAILDSIPRRAAVLERLSAFSDSVDIVQDIRKVAGRTFYEERAPGSDNLDLVVRSADGATRKLVDVAVIRTAAGGKPFAINYFEPSPDGSKVAVGISEGGSENASLTVYDASTGAKVAGPLPRARYGFVNWTNDSQALLVNLLNPFAPGENPANKNTNSKVYFWDMRSPPVPLLGSGVPGRIAFAPNEIPVIVIEPTAPVAFAINARGVQNEVALWTAPVTDVVKPGAAWTPLATRDDDVTAYTVVGNRIYLLSHKNAPTFKVLEVDDGHLLSSAKVAVPAEPNRIIEGISAASDALYVRARRGIYSELLRVPLDGGPAQMIALPFKGSIEELNTDPRNAGATVIVDGWVTPAAVLSYDPATGQFADLHLGKPPAGYDASRYAVSDLQVRAGDGVEVPLTLMTAKSARHPRALELLAYGSYGISQYPAFGRYVNHLLNNIDYAVCHVRGGGELGEAWRLGGKDANKPNSWRDLIACAEDLIARGYTTKKLLFIVGSSAGGITVGRAMEERPDLFAGVIDIVPSANMTRFEFTPGGPNNLPEFGSVKTEQGFRNLYAMDTVLHVKKGVQYPPIMITTGLNDPRVPSWIPAKLAATLQASGTRAPVLLRVDEEAGHGMFGSTKTQRVETSADVISFIKWRSGEPGWKPKTLAK